MNPSKVKKSAPPSAPIRIILKPAVCSRTGLSNSALYEEIRKGLFPKQVPLLKRRVGWVEHEVDQWIAERMARRPNV